MSEQKYIRVEDLCRFCENSEGHAITPNDFMRMNHYTPAEILAGMWVPVTERLPEDGVWCIISVAMTRDRNEPRLARYDGGCIFSEPEGVEWDADEDYVTHWMPLPQPPKEGTP